MKTPTKTTELDVLRLVRDKLHYDPATGIFTGRATRTSAKREGRPVGGIQHGRRRITVGGKTYKAARLAWLYMTGHWPREEIDHINRNSLDDRWCNLRDVDRSTNLKNRTTGWKRPDRSKYAKIAPRDTNGHFLRARPRFDGMHDGDSKPPLSVG